MEKEEIKKVIKKHKKYKILIMASILVFCLLIAYGIVVIVVMQTTIGYTKTKADAKIQKANSSSDLTDMSEYIEDYYDMILKDKSDNPKWWFPTEETNWDTIKHDTKKTISNAKLAANNSAVGSDAYEEALDEFKDNINAISEQVDEAFWWEYYATPLSCIIFWSWIGGFIFLIIMFIYLGHKINEISWDYRKAIRERSNNN